MPHDFDDDDDDKRKDGLKGKFKEFDCPSCNANNPCDPPFGDGEEILCNYCGTEYRTIVSDEGKLKLKEM